MSVGWLFGPRRKDANCLYTNKVPPTRGPRGRHPQRLRGQRKPKEELSLARTGLLGLLLLFVFVASSSTFTSR